MKRRFMVFAALAAILVFAATLFRRHVTVAVLVAQETRVRWFLVDHPVGAFVIGLIIYMIASLAPGTTGKAIVFGWLFGFGQGVLIVNLGLTAAAMLTFLLSRYLLQDAIQSRFPLQLERLNRALEGDGAFYLFALRMAHFPYTFANYAMGATSLRARSFWWATQLGMLPSNMVFVYAGSQMPTLRHASEQGFAGVFTPGLIAAFVLMGLLPLVVRGIARRIRARLKRGIDADT